MTAGRFSIRGTSKLPLQRINKDMNSFNVLSIELHLSGGRVLPVRLKFEGELLSGIELLRERLRESGKRRESVRTDLEFRRFADPGGQKLALLTEQAERTWQMVLDSQLSGVLTAELDLVKGVFSATIRDKDKVRVGLSRRFSPFAGKVYRELLKIGAGRTTTYGDLAKKCGTSARAVGRMLATNPYPILIPCHRVTGKDGELRGYSACDGVRLKELLLQHEGAF